ncbi:MAG: GUN4 domain-containing protein [Elainellaceae cyanobacterium]
MTPPQNPQPSQPQQKPPLEERLTDAVIKLLMTGSGGYALYSLYVDDVPKAAISGIVSFGFGLVTSFGQGFIKTLSDRMRQRGEASGQAIDEAIDTTLDKALTRLSGFHRQYLEALKTECYNLPVEGFGRYSPPLVLQKIYVPLRIKADSFKRGTNAGRADTNLKIWQLLPQAHHADRSFPYRLLAIIADPGYGKTTLIRFLTLSYANQSYIEHGVKELLPIRLLFRDFYGDIQSKTQPTLPQLIVKQVQQLPRCQELRTSEPWLKDQLMQGKCLVMLDGLDEVPDARRELLSRWANWQMQTYPSQFILTSRPHGYDGDLFDGVQPIDILDFTNDQKRTFIDQWYEFRTWETWRLHWETSQRQPEAQRLSREQAEAQSAAEATKAADDLSQQLFREAHLVELAKNPLLLTIIAVVHEAYGSLPTRRVWLYERIFNLLLEDRPNFRDTRLTLARAEENQKILQAIAARLVTQNITKFTPKQGSTWIEKRLSAYCIAEQLSPQQFLQEIQQISGLLAGGEGYLYEFTHKTFQEYLTAVELTQHPKGQQIALKQFENSDWKEVIPFYAALTDAKPFVMRALEHADNEYLLDLAQRLIDENQQISDELKHQLLQARQQLTPESAEVRLAQRFQSLMLIDETTAISEYITWGEYQLFLCDQVEKQFHSWAEEYRITTEQNDQLVTDLRWEDARWFCAWLSTQTNLAPDDGVYDYRLPTPDELTAVGANGRSPLPNAPTPLPHAESPLQTHEPPLHPWTSDPDRPGNALCVVRQRIPDRYRELVNYLANGRWKEADQETLNVMLEVTNQKAKGYFSLESLRNFPCDDLRIIDQLWVKFSGGKFGLSVQKEIWVEVGGKLDFGEDEDAARQAYRKMSDINGWQNAGGYISYDEVIFDTSAPTGHLPYRWMVVRMVGWWGFVFSSLASRLVKCKA